MRVRGLLELVDARSHEVADTRQGLVPLNGESVVSAASLQTHKVVVQKSAAKSPDHTAGYEGVVGPILPDFP